MRIPMPSCDARSVIPPPGSYTFGPDNGRILVKTYREGLARAIGHDLIIEVGEWSASVTVGEDPADTTITATAQVDSLNPIDGIGGVKPLSDADRSEIKKNIRKILRSPEISFQSSSVKVAGNSATVSGNLTIEGRSEVVDVQMTESDGKDGKIGKIGKIKGNFSVLHSRWGIKPYTGLMGALKVADRVDVEFEVSAPA
jgi:polyisoprenoid-binding protein YceI